MAGLYQNGRAAKKVTRVTIRISHCASGWATPYGMNWCSEFQVDGVMAGQLVSTRVMPSTSLVRSYLFRSVMKISVSCGHEGDRK